MVLTVLVSNAIPDFNECLAVIILRIAAARFVYEGGPSSILAGQVLLLTVSHTARAFVIVSARFVMANLRVWSGRRSWADMKMEDSDEGPGGCAEEFRQRQAPSNFQVPWHCVL